MGALMKPRAAYGIAAALVLLSALFCVGLYREVRQELTELVLQRRTALAHLAAATLSERIDRVIDVGASLATRVRFVDLVAAEEWNAAAQILANVPSQFRFVDRIGLYDTDGRLMASIPPAAEPRGTSFAYRDWYKGVSRNWQPYVSEVYLRHTQPEKRVFAVAVPIFDRAGAPGGILQLQVRLDQFFDWAGAIDVGAGGSFVVVDASGAPAFNSLAPEEQPSLKPMAMPGVERLQQGASAVELATDPFEGREYVYAFVRARQGWGIVVQQPAERAFAARDNQLSRMLAGYALIFAFLFVIGSLALNLLSQQRKLRTLNQELDDLYDHAPCGHHSVDAEGIIVRINETWLGWLGYTREEVLGKMRHADLMTEDSAKRFWSEVFPLFKSRGWLKNVEFDYRRKDGSVLPAALNATSVYDAKGRYVMSRSTVFDITARRTAEREIGELNRKLREAHERDQLALTRHTERVRILHAIHRAVVAGHAAEDIASAVIEPLRALLRVPRAIINRFDLDAGKVEWIAAAGRRRSVGAGVRYSISLMGDMQALGAGQPQLIDVGALPDGIEKAALLASGVRTYMAVPMIAGGELLGAISFGDDRDAYPTEDVHIAQEVATELAIALSQARLLERVRGHAAELELRVAERTADLEGANKELASCSYSVSHDLRAPLRAVDGYARMLEEDYADALDQEGRRLLAVVRNEAGRMGQLIDDLLLFSRTGQQPLQTVPVDMAALVSEVADQLRVDFPETAIDVDPLPGAPADRALLKQVWLNLVGNALKYSSKRSAAKVKIAAELGGAEVVYSVSDNGAGFDPRYAAKLFGVFQRLHRADEFPGTGVGLAIVQRVVVRHGGRVWADGAPGAGATFRFALPLGRPAA